MHDFIAVYQNTTIRKLRVFHIIFSFSNQIFSLRVNQMQKSKNEGPATRTRFQTDIVTVTLS